MAMDQIESIVQIDVNQLSPNPFQPRKVFDAIQMNELTKNIAEIGVIHPIVVRSVRDQDDQYEIVAGERRWRAAKSAGHKTIPSLVRKVSDQEMAQIALVENLQRADLNYFEEAEGYRMLIQELGLTQEEVARKVGKSQPTIANKLRILHIDPEVKEKIMVEMISERHVRALLKLRTAEEQIAILKQIYENDMNVSKTEQFITDYLEGRIEFIDSQEESEVVSNRIDEEIQPKKQTIRRMFSDLRIYVNTIKAAVTKIEESGIDVKMQEDEYEDGVKITIMIPREKR